jgi:hypothetical protein
VLGFQPSGLTEKENEKLQKNEHSEQERWKEEMGAIEAKIGDLGSDDGDRRSAKREAKERVRER